MKKVYSLLAAVLLLFSLAGCYQDYKPKSASGTDNGEDKTGSALSMGDFVTQDLDGNEKTGKDLFADYDITMVNVWASWCDPCKREIPDLQKLYENYADKKVGVVGILLDGYGVATQEPMESVINVGKIILDDAGATYPVIIPDASLTNGILKGIDSVPVTFFVDSEGNAVGEAYLGAKDLEAWSAIVDKLLEEHGS